MAEQIMWAVKRPDGQIIPWSIDDRSAEWAQKNAVGALHGRWTKAYADGYRCVRVKVSEVGDE